MAYYKVLLLSFLGVFLFGVSCLATKGTENVEKRGAAGQWCYCCDNKTSNAKCNTLKLKCYSQFPMCITEIRITPAGDKITVSKSCASPPYCQQQEARNPAGCADGLVPPGNSCEYCCTGQGCNEYPNLFKAYRPSPTSCPDLKTFRQKTAKGVEISPDQFLQCGKNRFDGRMKRIVGGSIAQKGFYPWMVRISNRVIFFTECAGTIIDERWIITAAHCIANVKMPGLYRAVAGDHRGSIPDFTEQEIGVSKIYVHPKYTGHGSVHDLALIKTTCPIQFNEHVQPICLPKPTENFAGEKCITAGWGFTGLTGNDNVMREVPQTVLPGFKCGLTGNHTACLYGGDGNYKGVCMFDAGSPTQCKKGDKWYLATVTQASPANCARPDAKAAHGSAAHIPGMMPWILQVFTDDAIGR